MCICNSSAPRTAGAGGNERAQGTLQLKPTKNAQGFEEGATLDLEQWKKSGVGSCYREDLLAKELELAHPRLRNH